MREAFLHVGLGVEARAEGGRPRFAHQDIDLLALERNAK
jgi:hypothetical protein